MLACLLPLVSAAERELFDFDWKFKYMGKGEPEMTDSPASASASEEGRPPACAVDGNLNTRWCAPDSRAGHFIQVHTGTRKKVRTIIIQWERPNNFEVDVEIVSGRRSRLCYQQSGFRTLSF